MTNRNSSFSSVIDKTQAYLKYLEQTGETFIPLPRVKTKTESASTKRTELLNLYQEVITCIKCDELAKRRKSVVFGSGNAQAELVFVGEAPGFDEDAQGLPFVGKAGQLLTKIIQAMGLTRNDVFICNVLKCRPPGNRNPLPEEIMNCKPYLVKQLEMIQPKVICALGNFAAQLLLKTDRSISELRGKFHDYHGIKVLPTYHPAYLLRNPSEKKKVWEDMKLIMAELHLSPEKAVSNSGR